MLLASSGGPSSKLYIDDVFSVYTYTGNGSTQTITNGIDLAGKGGLVWLKSRSAASENILQDTARGTGVSISSNLTQANTSVSTRVTSFNSTGFSLGAESSTNANAATYASWTFRKAPKFFDIVTYTGDGVAGKTIAHSLGSIPGMVIVKGTSAGTAGFPWRIWHNSLTSAAFSLQFNTAAQGSSPTVWNSTAPTASVFTVGTESSVNASGETYVAYLFAHDTSVDGLIQCGSFTTDAGGNASVNLGWEPQFMVMKKTTGTADGWAMFDSSRGWGYTGTAILVPNTSGAEGSFGSSDVTHPTATGFTITAFAPSSTYIYMAIRRPNKPPTTGTQVYNAIARSGTGSTATINSIGFTPDVVHFKSRTNTWANAWADRLRGNDLELDSDSSTVEASNVGLVSFTSGMNSVVVGGANPSNANGDTFVNHFFKRAPGFFDEVCWTGTGSNMTVAHNLTVVPELMIVKSRSDDGFEWAVYAEPQTATKRGILNGVDTFGTSAPSWNNTSPTASVFSVGAGASTNPSAGSLMVAYLFATLAGISKVGSYTGNGTTQTINCGFTTGARFILIKRTDAFRDWYVWDTVRGIVTANDPHLSLNTTSAEVTTDDSVDPDTSGFIVNQVTATNTNVTSATYIYLAIA